MNTIKNSDNTNSDKVEVIGLRIIGIVNTIIDYGVALIFLFMLLFGCYAMWDNNQIISSGDAAHYVTYKPTSEDSLSFEELQHINGDVFAWLTVYGTNIDYPVLQGKDNNEYLNKNPEGEFSLTGSIYLDSGNNKDMTDFNSIIYGHHMERGMMFGNLDMFTEQSYFDVHRYGNLYYDGKDHGLEFFAYLEADAYDGSIYSPGIVNEEAKASYLSNIYEKAKYTRDIGVSTTDQIVLLSTCASGSTNGRYIVVGRLSDHVFEDNLGEAEEGTVENNQDFFAKNFGFSIPMWSWIIVVIVIILLIMGIRKRKTDKERKENTLDNDKDKK